jgi:hypothetical protein
MASTPGIHTDGQCLPCEMLGVNIQYSPPYRAVNPCVSAAPRLAALRLRCCIHTVLSQDCVQSRPLTQQRTSDDATKKAGQQGTGTHRREICSIQGEEVGINTITHKARAPHTAIDQHASAVCACSTHRCSVITATQSQDVRPDSHSSQDCDLIQPRRSDDATKEAGNKEQGRTAGKSAPSRRRLAVRTSWEP